MSQHLAPVAVFAFNRPEHLSATLCSLALNLLAPQTTLHVFLDGPRADSDREAQVKIVQFLSSSIQYKFKSISLIQAKNNLGLAQSIIYGVTKITNEYGSVIVLEDDLVTSKYFLQYMNDGLNRYVNEDRVVSIHGYVNLLKDGMKESFFLKGADCWGWATWKRGWKFFEADGVKLMSEIQARGLQAEFNFENSADFIKMLRFQIEGKNNSWAVRWYASAFLNDKLTLYPAVSLVKNIGFDGSGTHCDINSDYEVDLAQAPVLVFPSTVEPSKEGYLAYVHFFNSIKPTLTKRVMNRLRKFMRFS